MKKYLFICCTPLQGAIAKRIIETQQLEKSKCILFFYTSFDNETYRKSFTDLCKLCCDGLYYVWKPNFPKYIFEAKKFFKKYHFNRFYMASIDSIFAQLAISQYNINDVEIYTFDDGTANIATSSRYYKKQNLNFKRLVFILLGNRLSSQKIKRYIKLHYTIYPNIKNISNNTFPLELFRNDGPNINRNTSPSSRCIVMLGTVYEEAFTDPIDINTVKDFITKLASRKTVPTYYLSHPREKEWERGEMEDIRSDLIAEEVILSLLDKFNTVELYSVGSTVQLNLAAVDGIENIYLKLSNQSQVYEEIRSIEKMITHKEPKTIVLK